MDLVGLAQLTGHLSITDMSREELINHLLKIRESRMITKAQDLKRTEADDTKPKKVRAMKPAKMPNLDTMSEAELEKLIAKLQGR